MSERLDHAELTRAVAQVGSATLEQLTASEEAYYTTPTAIPDVTARLLRVVPKHTSHPLDFLVAIDPRDGQLVVTTTHPAGVARVVLTEPALMTSPKLAAVVFELVRPRAVPLTLVSSAELLPEPLRALFRAPSQESLPTGGVAGEFQVLDRGRLMQWRFVLDEVAGSSLEKRELTTGGPQ